jgi:hypothetical protein
MEQITSVGELMDMAWKFRASRVLQLAHKLDIFTLLSGKPLSAGDVADACGSDPVMTEKLLIACCALGLLRCEGGLYLNSDLAEDHLVRGKPLYQGNWITHVRDDIWEYWGEVLEERIGGRRGVEPSSHRTFIMAMHEIAMAGEAEELAEYVDLSGRRLLFDVGGGAGTYAIFLCKRNPGLRAVVFDLPETIEIARKVIDEFGMSERITTIEGDWDRDDFGSGNDVVLMSNVLHGPGSGAEMKLGKAYRSMNAGGLLIIRDFILNENKTGPLSAALFNLMLGSYSAKEITELIAGAGFVNARELDIPHQSHSIFVAEKP